MALAEGAWAVGSKLATAYVTVWTRQHNSIAMTYPKGDDLYLIFKHADAFNNNNNNKKHHHASDNSNVSLVSRCTGLHAAWMTLLQYSMQHWANITSESKYEFP